jgi:hypothetical protein
MDRYTRVQVIPGKSYTCGCDLQRYTALVPEPHYVNRERCRVHDQPIAVAVEPTGHVYNPAHPIHCSCNAVPEVSYGILENRDERH